MTIIGLALPGLAETTFSMGALYNLGGPGYAPITGDYDGDGKLDPAAYEEAGGNWFIALSGTNYAVSTINLGGAGYTPVWGDYDGDGKADPAVYQETTGNWYAKLSGSNYEINWMPEFGEPGYEPMPGDYDGNGDTEMAVYQPSSGTWYLLRKDPDEITDIDILAGMYSNAMVNASNVVASKIRRTLTSITADNSNLVWRTNPDTGAREVLVTSFMKASVATNYYHVGHPTAMSRDSWVTLVPDLKNVCRAFTGNDLGLRLKQVLGLPANTQNDTIVEYYIDPACLLRPSRDPEITDREAEVAFRINQPYAPMVSTNFLNWFQRTIDSRNYGMTNGVWDAYPWTQLGYTYDWSKSGMSVMGLSEYVVAAQILHDDFGITPTGYVVTVVNAAYYADEPDNRDMQPRGSAVYIEPPDVRQQ
jgi:hypothetical protein